MDLGSSAATLLRYSHAPRAAFSVSHRSSVSVGFQQFLPFQHGVQKKIRNKPIRSAQTLTRTPSCARTTRPVRQRASSNFRIVLPTPTLARKKDFGIELGFGDLGGSPAPIKVRASHTAVAAPAATHVLGRMGRLEAVPQRIQDFPVSQTRDWRQFGSSGWHYVPSQCCRRWSIRRSVSSSLRLPTAKSIFGR